MYHKLTYKGRCILINLPVSTMYVYHEPTYKGRHINLPVSKEVSQPNQLREKLVYEGNVYS